MLNVNREKMSKSLRNYFLVREVLKGWRPEVVRVALLNAHYRTPLEYSTDVLEEARKVHDKIWGAWQSLPSEGEGERENRWVEKLVEILNDDLNTRKAFTLALEAVAKETDATTLRGFLEVFDGLFSVIPIETGGGNENALIDLLVEVRDRARKKRDYEMADYIRDALREMGILLEDTKEGTRWRRA
jgi:cysteinyl-tRNA synthetase